MPAASWLAGGRLGQRPARVVAEPELTAALRSGATRCSSALSRAPSRRALLDESGALAMMPGAALRRAMFPGAREAGVVVYEYGR